MSGGMPARGPGSLPGSHALTSAVDHQQSRSGFLNSETNLSTSAIHNLTNRSTSSSGIFNSDSNRAGTSVLGKSTTNANGILPSDSNGSGSSQTAASKSYANTAKKVVRVEGNASDIRKSTDKSLCYMLDTLPPTGMPMFVKRKFQSMKAFVPSKYKVNGGRTRIVLKITFDSSKETAESDFNAAKQFSMNFDGNEIIFKAMDSEDLDSKGTYVPRLMKKIYFSGLSMELAENSDIVKKGLEEWAEFDEKAEVKPMYEDGVFYGGASIRVKKYKKVLPKIRGEIDLPGIEWREPSDMLEDNEEGPVEGGWVETIVLTQLKI